jgi:Asp-tRNA(Asn)/Glu-tRNA(Gln) amidotransferase C subunit
MLRPATRTFTRLSSTYRLRPATWSIATLIPPSESSSSDSELTSDTLAHLHQLSALPPNSDHESQQRTLKLLRNHLHFVRAVQSVDTAGVTPLARIEDEAEPTELTFEDVATTTEQGLYREKKLSPMGDTLWTPMALPKRKVGGFYAVDEKVTVEEVEEGEKEGR